jgi:hypothetical protein
MRKLLMTAIVGAALTAATAANATSMLFQLDPSRSSIQVLNQGTCYGSGCDVDAKLLSLPSTPFSLGEGQTETLNFAQFQLSGTGLDTGVRVKATLAFIDPSVGAASSTGNAFYGTVSGLLSGGALTWDPIAPITTRDGSVFTVAFQDLKGFTTGAITDQVSITVDHLAGAVPEPATWATMLLGFFGLGAALRSRRKLASPVAA